MLARALGVTELVVIINKMDESSVGWNKGRFDEIKDKLSPFLQKACGYDLEKNVRWVPISGLFGVNIKEKLDKSVCDWYNGEPLLTLFDNLPVPPRDRNGAIRIPVLDKLKDQGACFVLGKVESGTIHPGIFMIVKKSKLITYLDSRPNSYFLTFMRRRSSCCYP